MITAIILASGTGLRFQNQQPKQFMKLAGLPVIIHTIKTFQSSQLIDSVVVVCHEDYIGHVWELTAQYGLTKVEKVVVGGATRQESSRIGIECCGPKTDYVLLHDSVRPFLTHKMVENLIAAVKVHGAVDTVIPSADTLVEVDGDGFITNIPARARFRRGQTPQAFDYDLVLDAHNKALAQHVENATDDCQLVMRLGHRVFTVLGDEQNIKITYPLDLHLADKLFQLNALTPQGLAGNGDVWNGKVFVIIGGTQGIGRSIVERLGNNGMAVVYALGLSSTPAVDVTEYASLQSTLEKIFRQEGRIDYVVNCAGDLIRKNVANMSIKEWDDLYRVNVSGNFYLAKALMPLWEQQKSGNLMLVGSSSYTRGRGGYAAYSSSKAALVNFCQALAEEVDCWNVKVNVANPGRVRTDLRFRNFGQEPPESLLSPDHVAEQILAALAMGTTGSVFEIR
jgi:2-C-methyl-D-erythritol 4-phosphate cytidylyltransferase